MDKLPISPPLPVPETTISRAAPALLRTLFLHHDGIVIGATLAALGQSGVLALLLREGRISLRDILLVCPARPGYLQVALRCLALQGWIERRGEPASDLMVFAVTPRGRLASAAFDLYREAAAFVYSGIPFSRYLFRGPGMIEPGPNASPFERYADLVEKSACGYGLRDEGSDIIRAHLDGLLAGPLMLALKDRGLLAGDALHLGSGGMLPDRMCVALALLGHLGWVEGEGDRWCLTETGRVASEFTLHYGLTLSYLPLFCQLPRLLFDSVQNITHRERGEEETHVDRTLNVLASGVAHRRYFEDADTIVREVFNREPIAEQPRFVADMGCGDGVWLERIYRIVCRDTLRGRRLDDYPLTMVGADYNVQALAVARRRLRAAEIPHLALFGDITDPDGFAGALREVGLAIEDGLHIRAFIDHNRRYTEPRDRERAGRRRAMSTGAYADQEGRAIPNAWLEENLVEHLRRWVPYTKQHGLIIIEAHDVAPEIAWRYGGRTHATAFDTYHGYSNQYPVDFDAFMNVAEEAGLRSLPYQHQVYPSRLPFVAISLNRFKRTDPGWLESLAADSGPDRHGWRPYGSEDREDGEALHRFLYRDGGIEQPRRWCFASTGTLVAAILDEIERRLAGLGSAPSASPGLRLADYGAGTGLATVEIIHALAEKGLLRVFQERRIAVELLVLDLPSGWFAKAYELLHTLPFVRFESLQDPASGRVRRLTDIAGVSNLDLVYASMVLHLVPPKALPVLIAGVAEALRPGGAFLWNTPDTAPAPVDAVVIHAANRRLRGLLSAVLDDEAHLCSLIASLPEAERERYEHLPARIRAIRQGLTPDQRARLRALGAKQVLPVPTEVSEIQARLSEHFAGTTSTSMSVLTEEDAIALALLPANQRYFGELPERGCREDLIRLLLRTEILPELRAGPAGNPTGLNLHWTFGRYVRRGR